MCVISGDEVFLICIVYVHEQRMNAQIKGYGDNGDRHAGASTAVLQTQNGQGGFILSAQPDKSILNAYYFQKVRVNVTMFVRPSHHVTYVYAGSDSA